MGKTKEQFGIFNLGPLYQGHPGFRVTLGVQMNAGVSDIEYPHPRFGKTGSIGFIDYILREATLEYRKDGQVQTMQGSALVTKTMGVEPRYRGQGYGRTLMERVEEIARARNVDFILGEGPNDQSRGLTVHLGYSLDISQRPYKIL